MEDGACSRRRPTTAANDGGRTTVADGATAQPRNGEPAFASFSIPQFAVALSASAFSRRR
jgi:hypothetical protein